MKKYFSLSLIALFFVSQANAIGKKEPGSPGNEDPDAAPELTTPQPLRKTVLQPIGTKVFQLPNGSTIDFNADLQSILPTAVTATAAFRPIDPSSMNVCNTSLEIRSAVTSFQLEVLGIGATFGYSPAGQLGSVTNITGKATLRVGLISMDFSVWRCTDGVCSAVAASNSTNFTANITGDIEVDFDKIKTGANLVFNTPLGEVLRLVMLDGMRQLADSPNLNELPWESRVREYTPAAGTLILGDGYQSRLQPSQAFEIYAPTNTSSTGVCNVYKTVGYVHTLSVDTVSSTAIVDRISDSRGIKVGDIVMIHAVPEKSSK